MAKKSLVVVVVLLLALLAAGPLSASESDTGGSVSDHASVPPDGPGHGTGEKGTTNPELQMSFPELDEIPMGFSLDGLHPSDTPGDMLPGNGGRERGAGSDGYDGGYGKVGGGYRRESEDPFALSDDLKLPAGALGPGGGGGGGGGDPYSAFESTGDLLSPDGSAAATGKPGEGADDDDQDIADDSAWGGDDIDTESGDDDDETGIDGDGSGIGGELEAEDISHLFVPGHPDAIRGQPQPPIDNVHVLSSPSDLESFLSPAPDRPLAAVVISHGKNGAKTASETARAVSLATSGRVGVATVDAESHADTAAQAGFHNSLTGGGADVTGDRHSLAMVGRWRRGTSRVLPCHRSATQHGLIRFALSLAGPAPVPVKLTRSSQLEDLVAGHGIAVVALVHGQTRDHGDKMDPAMASFHDAAYSFAADDVPFATARASAFGIGGDSNSATVAGIAVVRAGGVSTFLTAVNGTVATSVLVRHLESLLQSNTGTAVGFDHSDHGGDRLDDSPLDASVPLLPVGAVSSSTRGDISIALVLNSSENANGIIDGVSNGVLDCVKIDKSDPESDANCGKGSLGAVDPSGGAVTDGDAYVKSDSAGSCFGAAVVKCVPGTARSLSAVIALEKAIALGNSHGSYGPASDHPSVDGGGARRASPDPMAARPKVSGFVAKDGDARVLAMFGGASQTAPRLVAWDHRTHQRYGVPLGSDPSTFQTTATTFVADVLAGKAQPIELSAQQHLPAQASDASFPVRRLTLSDFAGHVTRSGSGGGGLGVVLLTSLPSLCAQCARAESSFASAARTFSFSTPESISPITGNNGNGNGNVVRFFTLSAAENTVPSVLLADAGAKANGDPALFAFYRSGDDDQSVERFASGDIGSPSEVVAWIAAIADKAGIHVSVERDGAWVHDSGDEGSEATHALRAAAGAAATN